MYATIARDTWGGVSPTATTPTATGLLGSTATASTYQPMIYSGLQEGMTQTDLGDGRYEMFDAGGSSLGYGYKDVVGAINDIGYNNHARLSYQTPATEEVRTEASGEWENYIPASVTPAKAAQWFNPLLTTERQEWVDSGSEQLGFQQTRYDPTAYNSQEELNTALRGVASYAPSSAGILGDWESLGQMINGAQPTFQGSSGVASNNADEQIKGTNALYGSTPTFTKGEDGKYSLIGYRTDIAPGGTAPDEDYINTETSAVKTHTGRKDQWSAAVWREMADPEWWKANTVMGDKGETFIPVEKVGEIPGWINKDDYNYYKQKTGGLFGAVFDFLDPILDKVDPLHNWTQDRIANMTSSDSQKEAFMKVAPIVVAVVAWAVAPAAAGAAGGGAGGAGAGGAAGAASGGAAAGAAGGAVAASGSAVASSALTALNAANALSQGDWKSALMAAFGAAGSLGAFSSITSSIGTAASEVATSLGMSAEMQTAASSAMKGFVDGDLNKMTGGAIDLGGKANTVVGAAVRNAVKQAAFAGATGSELEDAMSSAIVAGVSSLVGGTASSATDSKLAGSVASSVTSSLLGSAINSSGGDNTTQATTATTTTPQATPTTTKPSGYYARIARDTWS